MVTRSLMAILVVALLGLSACAGISNDIYPTPRPQDLPVGLDEGLISRDWDGGFYLRYPAMLLNPIGVLLDLLIEQPFYLAAYQEPELFGYTAQDELYRRRFGKSKYSWETFQYQYEQYQQRKAR